MTKTERRHKVQKVGMSWQWIWETLEDRVIIVKAHCKKKNSNNEYFKYKRFTTEQHYKK